ncbi:hypothetical protein [Kitasatospora cineracea]|uniref:hypothetical protein n=1 Tax=Kitasatospora cineracea TaxID=88074 RepID=UPI003801E4CA
MLAAQVLGLGLGAADARAADTGHPPHHPGRALGTVVRPGSGDGDLLDGAADALDPAEPGGTVGSAGSAGPAVTGSRPVEDLGSLLGHHLGTGELPLPGHHADRPDAFSLANGLLSAVPPQPRAEDAARASRSGPAAGREPDGDPAPAVPAQRTPADRGPAASPAAAPATTTATAATATTGRTPAPRPAPAPGTPVRAPRPAPGTPDHLALTAAPTRPAGENAVAVLLPIAAGLLLTAAAMYKHRGLPGGGH